MYNYKDVRDKLLKRMVDYEFVGYDPSAINFSPRAVYIRNLISKIPLSVVRKVFLSLYSRFIYYIGGFAIFLLKPKQTSYAKGLALVLSGLSKLDETNESLINDLISKILDKRIEGRYLWAHEVNYSFPGGQEVTNETPNLITSAFVANGFFDIYIKTKNEKCREIFLLIVRDIQEVIPYKVVSSDKICFMYTPVTSYHVHNANLHYSELLAKKISIGELESAEKEHLLQLIRKSVNYSISDFEEKGTYPYAGPPTEKLAIDNYHTGYLLRSLYEIDKHLSLELDKVVQNLLNFYLKEFVVDGYIVRDSENTLQSHSLAEAILISKIFGHQFSECTKNKMQNSINKTMHVLYCKKRGCFINNVKRIGPFFIKDRTEMIRWSNCWMFYALSYKK